MNPRSVRALPVAGVVLLGVVLGCGDEADEANRPPTVTLQSGPFEGDTVSYRLNIAWSGDDPDGRIVRYEVATDPPIAFSEDEIAYGGPGIDAVRRPGAAGAPDTTRVIKGDASFDWIHTIVEDQAFWFSTEEPESVYDAVQGRRRPTGRFHGMHAVYVRAVDDDGAPSEPAHVAFTARTVAPSAEITAPNIEPRLLNVGSTFSVRWTGTDPDGAGPVGYFFKILNVTELGLPCTADIDPNVLFFHTNDGDPGWVYQDADTTDRAFALEWNRCYLLGVRAVDDAGAVEPFLEYGRNVSVFRTVPISGWPVYSICTPSQCFTYGFPDPGARPEVEIPDSEPLRFRWSGAESTSWGIDVPDPESEGSVGWSPWGVVHWTPELEGYNLGRHVLHVRFRRGDGSVFRAELAFRRVHTPLDQEVLYVDDWPDATYPRDPEHDAFWLSLFGNAGGRFQAGDVSQWNVFGLDDLGQTPIVPTLEQLGRYKLLVWNCAGAGGYAGKTGLTTLMNGTLATYLRAGGKVWLSGTYTVGATRPRYPGSQEPTLEYPITLRSGDFAWDLLKIQAGTVGNNKGQNADNNLVRVIAADSIMTGESHIYESMHVDGGKINVRSADKSVPGVDAILEPIFAETYGFRGDLDTLYVYGTQARIVHGRRSGFDYRVCALRWHDPDPAREQGRVQWFGFPMYYFKTDQAQDTFNKSIDWFREE